MLVNFHSELRATPSSETILQTPRLQKKVLSFAQWLYYNAITLPAIPRSLWCLCGGIYTSSQNIHPPSWNLHPLYNWNFQRSLLLPHLCFYNPYAAIFPHHQYMTWDFRINLCTMPLLCHLWLELKHVTEMCDIESWTFLGSCLWWKCLGTNQWRKSKMIPSSLLCCRDPLRGRL